MTAVADQLISKSGRLASYGKAEFTADLVVVSSFLAWAEQDGEIFGGETAEEAFRSMCRLLDIDPIRLRKIALGERN